MTPTAHIISITCYLPHFSNISEGEAIYNSYVFYFQLFLAVGLQIS